MNDDKNPERRRRRVRQTIRIRLEALFPSQKAALHALAASSRRVPQQPAASPPPVAEGQWYVQFWRTCSGALVTCALEAVVAAYTALLDAPRRAQALPVLFAAAREFDPSSRDLP